MLLLYATLTEKYFNYCKSWCVLLIVFALHPISTNYRKNNKHVSRALFQQCREEGAASYVSRNKEVIYVNPSECALNLKIELNFYACYIKLAGLFCVFQSRRQWCVSLFQRQIESLQIWISIESARNGSQWIHWRNRRREKRDRNKIHIFRHFNQ